MHKIDLNCDMGESSGIYHYEIGKDLEILQYVSSINLACGFHAGDPHTMHQLVESAIEKGVAIGAHPSFYDKENFGRKKVVMSPEHVYDITLYQLGALYAFLHVYGARIHHLKPHGALYNLAARERVIADAISLAIAEFDNEIILYGLSGSEIMEAGKAHGLKTASEVFADRTYQEDGTLTPRDVVGAVIRDEHAAIQQVLGMIRYGRVNTLEGRDIPIKAETLCVHGDNENALAFAKSINQTLKAQHVLIQQP